MPRSAPHWLAPSAEVLTVGLPFCVFKLLTGWILVPTPLAAVGYMLLALGAVDLVLNAANLAALLALHRRVGRVCTADLMLGRRDLALAVDVFVSFALVAIVVGFGLLLRLPSWALMLWNLAVVVNVLGAGTGALLGAMRRDRAS